MRNIELKARLVNREGAVRACGRIGATLEGDLHQVDTYFCVDDGRFKLRELEPGDDYLVYYRRADAVGPKDCDYYIAPAAPEMKLLLTKALGVRAVVDKVRTLYLWENVRIHLDRVSGLGDFIEFEAVLDERHNDQDGHQKLDRLIDAFNIRDNDHESQSYVDLIEMQGTV